MLNGSIEKVGDASQDTSQSADAVLTATDSLSKEAEQLTQAVKQFLASLQPQPGADQRNRYTA
jgi:methyl-accepting chemotaxis protein